MQPQPDIKILLRELELQNDRIETLTRLNSTLQSEIQQLSAAGVVLGESLKRLESKLQRRGNVETVIRSEDNGAFSGEDLRTLLHLLHPDKNEGKDTHPELLRKVVSMYANR